MKIFQVDSFTTEYFKGNPAGVCITEAPLNKDLMQKIARELAVSETAFVVPKGHNQFLIRFFTPTTEVPLCGHATLASAHIIWSNNLVTTECKKLVFNTTENKLCAEHLDTGEICLTFPVLHGYTDNNWLSVVPNLSTPAISETDIIQCWKVLDQKNNPLKLIVELKTDVLVRRFNPNLQAICELSLQDGLIITSRSSDSSYDIVSRYFAPQIGIPEDPVTGVAHCALAKYWEHKIGKTLRAFQASERGGNLTVELGNETVRLTGSAITLFELLPQWEMSTIKP